MVSGIVLPIGISLLVFSGVLILIGILFEMWGC